MQHLAEIHNLFDCMAIGQVRGEVLTESDGMDQVTPAGLREHYLFPLAHRTFASAAAVPM
ncbi:MAG: hypothetical protein DHS20C03_31880 [Minwuia thermotolerans]|nr:MAG: hypothetical protein DHS20C03_31880 [Minwuia thermotolerans]